MIQSTNNLSDACKLLCLTHDTHTILISISTHTNTTKNNSKIFTFDGRLEENGRTESAVKTHVTAAVRKASADKPARHIS